VVTRFLYFAFLGSALRDVDLVLQVIKFEVKLHQLLLQSCVTVFQTFDRYRVVAVLS